MTTHDDLRWLAPHEIAREFGVPETEVRAAIRAGALRSPQHSGLAQARFVREWLAARDRERAAAEPAINWSDFQRWGGVDDAPVPVAPIEGEQG